MDFRGERMRINLLIFGLALFFLGALMYIASSPSATAFVTGTFGTSPDLTQALSRGSILASSMASSFDVFLKVKLGAQGAGLGTMALGILVALLSGEDRFERIKKEGAEAHKKPGVTTTQRAHFIITIIPSIFISWFVLVLLYFLGFASLWDDAVSLIFAVILTSFMVNLASGRKNRHIAYMIFFAFIFVSSLLGGIIIALLTDFVQHNILNIWYAAFLSLVAVILVYFFFHTQQFKEPTFEG